MVCEVCGNLMEDCECEKDEENFFDFDDEDVRVWGYDGDAL